MGSVNQNVTIQNDPRITEVPSSPRFPQDDGPNGRLWSAGQAPEESHALIVSDPTLKGTLRSADEPVRVP